MLVDRCWWQAAAMYAKTRCMCAEGRLSKVTRGGTRTRNLLLRREAPYPLGHTSPDVEVVLHRLPKRLGLVWLGLAWFGLVWLGLVCLGLAWFGLVWLGLAWLWLGVCYIYRLVAGVRER